MIKKRILLTDDEPDFLAGAKPLFETKGFSVDTASNGDEAIKKMQFNGFNAAIIDLHMPEMDGVDTAREIQKMKPNIPIYFLTAHEFAKYEKKATEQHLRIKEWFSKPLPVKKNDEETFFNKIEFGILQHCLEQSKNENALNVMEQIMEEVDNLEGYQIMRFLKDIVDLPEELDRLDALKRREKMLDILDSTLDELKQNFSEVEIRLQVYMKLKQFVLELKKCARNEAEKDGITILYGAMRHKYAENLKRSHLQAINRVLKKFRRGQFTQKNAQEIDSILIDAGLDMIPNI